jgi:uncharacterized membrane protein
VSTLQWIFDLAEKHAGLGGWVGAVGAVFAIFVTWGLARLEYLRTKRQAIARERAEIRLIILVILDFNLKIMEPYIKGIRDNSDKINEFYSKHMNDSEMHAMTDLAHLPVTQ